MRSNAIRRFGSYFVDEIILGIFYLPFLFSFLRKVFQFTVENTLSFENDFLFFQWDYLEFIKLSFLISLVTRVLYFVILPLLWNGKTIGRKICGIRVKKMGGSNLSFGTLFAREVIFKELWWTFTFGLGALIDFLMVALREDRQTIRDIVMNTKVIEDHDF
ncbi:RDD family protein [Mycoplasmatota bacterium zrk1]